MEVTDEQVDLMFNIFDGDRSGTIKFDEFVYVLRGDMNQKRKDLVEAAFKTLDKDNSGMIEVEDIIGTYNAKNHPAVKECRKTEQEVLEEFLQTFEMHHNNSKGEQSDFKITREEFTEYYSNISASIDEDVYFEAMMNAAWNLSGNAPQYKKYGKGWTNDQDDGLAHKPGQCYSYKNVDATGIPTMISGMMSCDNPFSNITQYYDGQDPSKRTRSSLANDTLPKPNNKPGYLYMTGCESQNMALDSNINQNYDKFLQENKVPNSGAPKPIGKEAFIKQQKIDMELF